MKQVQYVQESTLADCSSFPFPVQLAPLSTRVVHLALFPFKESALCPCKDTMTTPDSANGPHRSHDPIAAGIQILQYAQSGAQSGADSNGTGEWDMVTKMDVDDNTQAESRRDEGRKRDRDREDMYVDAQGIVNTAQLPHISFVTLCFRLIHKCPWAGETSPSSGYTSAAKCTCLVNFAYARMYLYVISS
jgi:hypothetical protein